MKKVFEKPKMLTDVPFHYCPGCSHGIVHRMVASAIDKLNAEKVIGVAPVGCAVFAYDYFNCDMQEAAHGRAPAVATGIKRTNPDAIVFAYQGDGDLASIGMAEIVHAAARSENMTVIFINNAIYGMTGGQMAPTTLMEQVTTTTPYGRKQENTGNPINMAEIIGQLEGCYYSERVAVTSPANIQKTKKAIKKAFQYQMEGKGLSFVEVLSPCPTGWKMKATDALKHINDIVVKQYPLAIFKDLGEGEKQ